MIKKLLATCFMLQIFVLTPGVKAQDFTQSVLVRNIAAATEGYYEGFYNKTIPNSFNYHSFRHDLGPSMITRCLSEPMPVGWQTSVVPENDVNEMIGFGWVAAVNLNNADVSFSVKFNGIKRFEIPASDKKHWTINGENGSLLGFSTMMTDRHGDGHGYMYIQVPADWVVKGRSQEIEIVGETAGKSTWIIVYEAKDAMSFLKNSARFDSQIFMSVEKESSDYILNLKTLASILYENSYWSTGKKKLKLDWKADGHFAIATLEIPEKQLSEDFILADSQGELLVWNFTNTLKESSMILPQGVLKNIKILSEPSGFQLLSNRSWMPSLVESILSLSKSTMGNSEILLMNSSHQDIAWMDTPEKCIVERDTMLLQPLFNRAEVDPDYRFDIEDALMIKEYIQRHPDKTGLVKQLFADGRISCGATYIQPYEEMYSGEALARQFYFGAKWLKDEFNYTADTYWNVDVPGRTLQMPQLMAKAGVNNLVMTRQELGFYDWYGPDGSKITGFSNGHYGDSYTALTGEYYITLDYLAKYAFHWEPFYKSDVKKVIPVLSDWDMSPAKDYSELISAWNGISSLKNTDGELVPVKLPNFREALAPEMFDNFRKSNPIVKKIYGERPALWLYIHGPSHQKAIKSSREGDILLTQLEKIATINALNEGSFKAYPEARIRKAWEEKIYPDHGWGGKGGEITDAYFWQKYDFARSEANDMMNVELVKLASSVKINNTKDRPILVFNSLSWTRSGVVKHELGFDPGTTRSVRIYDHQNQEVPVQLSDVTYHSDRSIHSATLNFIAPDLPSIGYKVFFVKTSDKNEPVPMPKQGKRIENQFYIIEFGAGGLNRIFDKELNSELLLPEGFTAGEVFTLQSIGNGAGEFDQVQQPDTTGFDKTGNYKTEWTLKEDGPVFAKYSYRQSIRNAVVEQNVLIYKNLKRIDFDLALLNWEGVLYREYRMALPINSQNGKIVYEVPYGKLEVGADEMEGDAGERYTVPAKDIHPRAIQNWVNVSSEKMGVTLSSSVTGLDYVDITEQADQSTLIQPILLASRRSCHGLGNEYLQTGDHYFHFSLNSHNPGWENGYKFGVEANEHPLVVSDFKPFADANLPGEKSFFKTDKQNVVISVMKKAEDSDAVIIRAVESEGKSSQVQFQSSFQMREIQKTNLIEQLQGKPFNPKDALEIGKFSIETYQIKLQ